MKKIIQMIALIIVFGITVVPAYAGTFSDDFNDGNTDGWWLGFSHHTPWVWGNWRVEDGKLVQDQPGDGFIALVENIQISDQTVETQLQTYGPSGYGGVTIWYQDSNYWTDVRMYPAAGEIWVEETGLLYRYPNLNVLGCATQCTLRVDADGTTGNLDIYIDGVYLLTHSVTTTVRTGRSGFYSGNAGGYFDNFIITSDSIVDPLTDKSQCKNGGWRAFTNPTFKNQGACVSYLKSN